jgi:hypothetical protein
LRRRSRWFQTIGEPWGPITAEELAAFLDEVRAECDAALARLDTVVPALLRPNLRKQYEEQRQGWLDLRALAEDDAMALHELACLRTGRELTQPEARALLRRQ